MCTQFFVPVSQVSFFTLGVVAWNALRSEGWKFQRGNSNWNAAPVLIRLKAGRVAGPRQGRQNQQKGDRAVNQAQSVHPHSPGRRSDR